VVVDGVSWDGPVFDNQIMVRLHPNGRRQPLSKLCGLKLIKPQVG